ncbi:CDP-alcohol phosphatidyltransferase family protein [Mucilaginibacter sp.]|uniref:CDP-alcohol phosphatidyltransferase family protein n=1 Tax=Mucilaginibacter sp. TaxID=1882438 RepID=UPI003B000E78
MVGNAVSEPETTEPGEADRSKKIFQDRKRTNILRKYEQQLISYLVKNTPLFFTSNVLTFIGFLGSLLVFIGFVLATYINRNYLLLGVIGFIINWYGDSLDGRIAYYRNIPRKWFGFALDIIMDWVATVFIGLGYMVYAKEELELAAFLFVVLYGWAMIISQIRYKITDNYTIDAGLLGPTEIRILLALVLITEVIFKDTIQFFAITMCAALFIINCLDTRNLLKLGDERDREELELKSKHLPNA